MFESILVRPNIQFGVDADIGLLAEALLFYKRTVVPANRAYCIGIITKFCVKNEDGFLHDSGDRHHWFFAVSDEALVEITQIRVEAARGHCGHEEAAFDAAPSAAGSPVALRFSAVPGMRAHWTLRETLDRHASLAMTKDKFVIQSKQKPLYGGQNGKPAGTSKD